MKKIAIFLTLALCLSIFAGCGNTETAETQATEPQLTAPEGTTEELMNKIYENVTMELPLMTMPVDLTDEYAVSTFLGMEGADAINEASVSESMIGAQAYSITLARVKDAAQAETVAQSMFDNIDTRKWVCVEATEKQAVVCGDLVLFVMLNPEYGITCDQIVESFTAVCGGTVGTVLK